MPLVTSDQVAATIALLLPGFVALKVFYIGGQRTKRADWEWVLWSVLASVPIALVAEALLGWAGGSGAYPDRKFFFSLLVAVLGAALAAGMWRYLRRRFPRIREKASLQAWDAVLSQPHWVQVKVGDLVFSGKVNIASDPVESDALDIYLTDPALLSDDGQAIELSSTQGVLIAREKIDWIQVLKPAGPPGGPAK